MRKTSLLFASVSCLFFRSVVVLLFLSMREDLLCMLASRNEYRTCILFLLVKHQRYGHDLCRLNNGAMCRIKSFSTLWSEAGSE